jgi:hypothetical protein
MEAVLSGRREVAISQPRGAGKTTLLGCYALWELVRNPRGNDHLRGRSPRPGRGGRQVVRSVPTLQQAGEAWQAKAGVIRAAGGHLYKPATIREYERALRRRANPALGPEPLDEITRADLQELVDLLASEGLAATTIETTFNAVRAIYRHELARDRVKANPIREVTLPSGGNRRDRFATPTEAKALLAVLPEEDRAVWATAFYAGLGAAS